MRGKQFTVLVLTLALLLLAGGSAQAGQPHPERYYQEQWCTAQGGQMEVVLPDGTRCDCLTKTHAVEVDFARKWAEAVGQALNYARQSGRAPGVLLILERPEDARAAERLRTISLFYGLGLTVWTMPAGE